VPQGARHRFRSRAESCEGFPLVSGRADYVVESHRAIIVVSAAVAARRCSLASTTTRTGTDCHWDASTPIGVRPALHVFVGLEGTMVRDYRLAAADEEFRRDDYYDLLLVRTRTAWNAEGRIQDTSTFP